MSKRSTSSNSNSPLTYSVTFPPFIFSKITSVKAPVTWYFLHKQAAQDKLILYDHNPMGSWHISPQKSLSTPWLVYSKQNPGAVMGRPGDIFISVCELDLCASITSFVGLDRGLRRLSWQKTRVIMPAYASH